MASLLDFSVEELYSFIVKSGISIEVGEKIKEHEIDGGQ